MTGIVSTYSKIALILVFILGCFSLTVFFAGGSPVFFLILLYLLLFLFGILLKPFVGVCIYVFLSLHSQLVSQHVLGIGVKNLLLLIIGSCVILQYLGRAMSRDRRVLNLNGCTFFVLNYGFFLLLCSSLNGTEKYLSVVYYILYIISVIGMLLIYISDKNNFKIILSVLLFSGLVLISFGIFEVIIGRTFFYSAWTLAERYRFGIMRMGSTVADPNYVCFAIIPLIPIAVCFLKESKKRLVRIYYFGMLVFFVGGVLLTVSRIGWLVLAFVFLYLNYQKIYDIFKKNIFLKSISLSIFIILVVGIGLGGYRYLTVMSESQGSSNVRAKALQISWDNFRKHPFVGVGFYQLEEANAMYIKSGLTRTGGMSSMNTYMKILAEDGIFVFLCFIGIIITAYRRLLKLEDSDQVYGYIRIGFISWLLIAMTLNSSGGIIFWSFIAISMRERIGGID